MDALLRLTAWLALLVVGLPAGAAHAEQLLELRLGAAPHAPADAPDVIVHVPSHFDPAQPLDLVIFLHGFSSCARALVASGATACTRGGEPQRGYGLAAAHERAGTNTLLVVPQLAFLARRADAPRFERAGGLDAFLNELLRSALQPVLSAGAGAPSALRSVSLVAHSAGYRAAAAILDDPQRKTEVSQLVLLDALYACWDVFARWAQRDRNHHRIVSLYTHDPKTTAGNRQLAALLGTRIDAHTRAPLAQRLASSGLVFERVRTPHALIPERHMEALLRALFGAS